MDKSAINVANHYYLFPVFAAFFVLCDKKLNIVGFLYFVIFYRL